MSDILRRLNRAVHRIFARVGEGLGNLGAAITGPVERMFTATIGRIFRVAEGFERVEDWLAGLWRLGTWPFRKLWQGLAAAAGAILPRSARHAVGAVAGRAGAGIWTLAERLNLDGPMRRLAWALQPVWRPAAAIVGFAYAWLATRPYKRLLWGAPALVLLVPVAAAVTWNLTWGRESVAAHYRLAVQEARDAEDYETTALLERKLVRLGVDTQTSDYRAALELEKAGQLDDAYERMRQLAPEERVGYPAAHNWIFLKLLTGAIDLPQEERARLAGVHLEHLKRLGAQGSEFELMHAIWLAQGGKLEEAIAELAPLTAANEVAAIERMELNLRLERLDDARNDARAVRDHLQEARRRDRQLSALQYQAWALAEQLVGNSADWAVVVREWLAKFPDDAQARRSVVLLDAQQFDEMLRGPRPDAGELAERLLEMARLMETPTSLEPQIAILFNTRKQSPVTAALIERLIAAPDAPLPLVNALGTAAALGGEVELARTLLARVVVADEENLVAWNNYAWALSQAPAPDLERALEAVNHALAHQPDEFRFRETRGQILIALGRWEQAIEDLEFALNGMPDVPAIHASLAKAYEASGQAELAEIHRQHAQ